MKNDDILENTLKTKDKVKKSLWKPEVLKQIEEDNQRGRERIEAIEK